MDETIAYARLIAAIGIVLFSILRLKTAYGEFKSVINGAPIRYAARTQIIGSSMGLVIGIVFLVIGVFGFSGTLSDSVRGTGIFYASSSLTGLFFIQQFYLWLQRKRLINLLRTKTTVYADSVHSPGDS